MPGPTLLNFGDEAKRNRRPEIAAFETGHSEVGVIPARAQMGVGPNFDPALIGDEAGFRPITLKTRQA